MPPPPPPSGPPWAPTARWRGRPRQPHLQRCKAFKSNELEASNSTKDVRVPALPPPGLQFTQPHLLSSFATYAFETSNRADVIHGLTLSEDGCGVDGPLPPALLRDFLLGAEVVGQRHTDDGHRLRPRPVAVGVRADDLRPRHVGLVWVRSEWNF